MRLMKTSNLAVIGAGISGLICATTLAERGWRVTVFEKSRGVGGRMAVRRTDQGMAFDHGAQYFTVRDDRFAAAVAAGQRNGVIAPWAGRIDVVGNDRIEPGGDETPRFIGVPGMNALCKQLALGLEVRCQTKVSPPQRVDGVWRIHDEQGALLGNFDHVVISTPSPQAADLLAEAPQLAQRARGVAMQPCWTVMLAFEGKIDVEFDGAFVHNSSLSWICRNSSKPKRSNHLETWVIHAGVEWSSNHIHYEAAFALEHLLAAFWETLREAPQTPRFAAAHLWRYARPSEPLIDFCMIDPDLGLGVCGDWCGGSRVESAFLSGLEIAERLLHT